MAGSLAAPVKRAVIDGLAETFAGLPGFNAAEDEVVVTYGYQFGSKPRQCVFTGRARAETPPGALRAGRNKREERGRFDLNVLVQAIGGDLDAADDRLDEIGVVIEEWVADRKSGEGMGLSADGLVGIKAVSWDSDYFPVDSGVAAIRTYSIEWVANLY